MAYRSPFFPVLDELNDGSMISRVAVVALHVMSGVAILVGVISIIAVLKIAFSDSVPTQVTLGGLLYAVVVGGMAAAAFDIFRYHARQIGQGDPSAFPLMRIVSVLLRVVGEIYATILVGIGVGGMILGLFEAGYLLSSGPMTSLPGMPSMPLSGFLGGLLFFALCAVFAFIAVMFFHYLAEISSVLSDIARNIRVLVQQEVGSRTPPPALAFATSGTGSAPASSATLLHPPALNRVNPATPSAVPTCPSCGAAIVGTDVVFCGDCGTRLRPGPASGV